MESVEIEEGQEPKEAAKPFRPTQAEVDRHYFTHIPFRNWCRHCVLGRAKNDPHREVVERERDVIPQLLKE